MNIPKYTAPLVKGIRTTEGLLTTVVATLISVMSLVDPASLPHKEGGLLISGLTGLYALQRGLVKAAAALGGAGMAPPIDDPTVNRLSSQLEAQAGMVSTLAKAVGDLQSTHLQIDPESRSVLSSLEETIGQFVQKLTDQQTAEVSDKPTYHEPAEQTPAPADDAPALLADPVVAPDVSTPAPAPIDPTNIETYVGEQEEADVQPPEAIPEGVEVLEPTDPPPPTATTPESRESTDPDATS